MSLITFQKRDLSKEHISTDYIEDLTLMDESSLNGFQIGDKVVLSLDIPQDLSDQYKDHPLPGITFRVSFQPDENAAPKYEAIFEFKVINREHFISRDWMNKPHQTGFRLSSTTITLESTNDEAERIFSELQLKFNNDFMKKITDEA